MTNFKKADVRKLADEINEALQDLAKRHGVAISKGGGSYSDKEITLKVKISAVGDGGEVHDEAAETFKELHMIWGLKATDLGKPFVTHGKRFTLVGANFRAKRYPILGADAQGKRYKFAAIDVAAGLKTAAGK